MTEGLGDRGSPGSWLREQRRVANLTPEELAERSGLRGRALRSLEHDRIRKPYLRSVRQMIDALGLSEAVGGELIARFRSSQNAGLSDTPPAHVPPSTPAGLEVAATLPPRQVPRQLPPTSRQFVGRRAELERLTQLLDQVAGTPGALLILAITGTAGVGKTALAIHWAHQVAHRFPDGQLYVNLRGFDPSGTPLAAADALAAFLRALGVSGPNIPAITEERAAEYRSL